MVKEKSNSMNFNESLSNLMKLKMLDSYESLSNLKLKILDS